MRISKSGIVVALLIASTSGCFDAAKHLGDSLPPQQLKNGQMPLRFDAFYVCQAPRGYGLPGDRVSWVRFWPDGRAITDSWPLDQRGWPTAADGETTRASRGRYSVVGDALRIEFLFPIGDQRTLRTWFAHLGPDGGFTLSQWQDNYGRHNAGRIRDVLPPFKYHLHVVGPMKGEANW